MVGLWRRRWWWREQWRRVERSIERHASLLSCEARQVRSPLWPHRAAAHCGYCGARKTLGVHHMCAVRAHTCSSCSGYSRPPVITTITVNNTCCLFTCTLSDSLRFAQWTPGESSSGPHYSVSSYSNSCQTLILMLMMYFAMPNDIRLSTSSPETLLSSP